MWIYTRKHVRHGEKRTRYCEFEQQYWRWVPAQNGLGYLYQGYIAKKGLVWLAWSRMDLRRATEIVTAAQDCVAQAAQLQKDINDASRGQ